MTRYQWLLFDADDTLFDFGAAEDSALTQTLLHFGLTDGLETKTLYKDINSALWRAFDRGEVAQEDLVVERFVRFLAALGKEGDPEAWNGFYFDHLSQGAILLPGALELCQALAGRYTLALITNGYPFVQRRRLSLSPLAPLFGERVYISGELGCRKPEPVYFEKVLTDLGAADRRSEVLVIGDSLSSDIRGAVSVGLDSVWYDPRGREAGPIQPTYHAANYRQLTELLLP